MQLMISLPAERFPVDRAHGFAACAGDDEFPSIEELLGEATEVQAMQETGEMWIHSMMRLHGC